MGKNFKKALLLAILLILAVSIFACGSEPKAVLTLLGGAEKDGFLTVSVSSATESIDLKDYIAINSESEMKIYSSEEMDDEIDSIVSLQTGENNFYVKVKQGMTKNTYKIKVVRKSILSVTFDSNGGTPCQTICVDDGSVIEPPVSTREGYDFIGWGYDFSTPITENKALVAQWSPKKYTVTSNDFASVEVTFGEAYTLPTVSKHGYIFSKWINDAGEEIASSGTWSLAQNLNVSAVYDKEIYTITYVYGASTANQSATYTIEDAITLINPATPEGLNFMGWYDSLDYTNKISNYPVGTTGNITLYAKWLADEEIEHFITVDAEGYEFDEDVISVYYGGSYTLPAITDVAGYTYAWKVNGEKILSSGIWDLKTDATVVLEWTKIEYNITYITDSKTTNPNTNVTYNVETPTITLLNPTRPNATFVGWFTTPEFLAESKVESIATGTINDITLYAKFEINYSTIKYNLNGASGSLDDVKLEIGDAYELPTPSSLGMEFVGWYIDVNNEATKLSNTGTWSYEGETTLVAKWNYTKYSLNLTVNGKTEVREYTIVDEVTLPTPSVTGFVFMGWKEYGSSSVYQNVVITKGTTGTKSYTAVLSRFEYSFDFATKTATVVRYVKTASVTSVVIPTSVNSNGVDYSVTTIGSSVFENMGNYIVEKNLSKFSVEIPKTLTTINQNAFKNCIDVEIKVILDRGVDTTTWANSLVVASGNDHVVDVIKGLRPAIGWSIYG